MYNFAYGANCSKESVERRKLEPIESIPARLPGFKVTFRLVGVPLIEPVMGDVEVADDEPEQHEIHGVAHLLTKKAWRRLQVTEGGQGVDRAGYIPHKVKAYAYDGREIEAYVLMTERGKCLPNPVSVYGPPSARYVGKILQGAEYGVDERYLAAVKQLPVTEPSLPQKLYVGALLITFSPFLLVGFLSVRVMGGSLFSNVILANTIKAAWWISLPFIPANARRTQPVTVSIKPHL